MKKKAALLAAIAVGGLSIGGTAGAAPTGPDIDFNDTFQRVVFTLPTNPCTDQGCQWELILTNPKTMTELSSGSSGVGGSEIVLPYPSDYCGNLQADGGIVDDSGTFHLVDYHVKDIATCTPPTTTTTTSTTTTTTPTTSTTTSTTVPPLVTQPPASSPPSIPGGPSTPSVPQGVSPTPSSTTSPAAAPQLPFTGVDWQPLAIIGGSLAMTGLALLKRKWRWTR